MSTIQIVLVLFAAFAFSRAAIGFRRGTVTLVQLVLWLLFWGAVVVVAIHPETTVAMARAFGVGRGADLAIYLALVLLFFLQFRLFARIEDVERQLTRVVRALALRDLDERDGPPRV